MGVRKNFTMAQREAILKKVINRGERTVAEMADQEGVGKSTLTRWLSESGKLSDMTSNSKKKWTAEEKLNALQETYALGEQELGAYLRQNGLHSQRLTEWRAEILGFLSSSLKSPRIDERDQKIRELEAELTRKEKALAEASALLILQKKVDLIWGSKKEGKK